MPCFFLNFCIFSDNLLDVWPFANGWINFHQFFSWNEAKVRMDLHGKKHLQFTKIERGNFHSKILEDLSLMHPLSTGVWWRHSNVYLGWSGKGNVDFPQELLWRRQKCCGNKLKLLLMKKGLKLVPGPFDCWEKQQQEEQKEQEPQPNPGYFTLNLYTMALPNSRVNSLQGDRQVVSTGENSGIIQPKILRLFRHTPRAWHPRQSP